MKNLPHHRTPIWFFITFGVLLLVRLPFLRVQYIPHYVPFEPWIALVPLAGVFWGLPGAFACAAAALTGDRLAGIGESLPVYRAIGYFVMAASARQLWCAVGSSGAKSSWPETARFIAVSLPGCFAAAAWTGLGVEFLRLYPFSYGATIVLINHLVFMPLFGLALFRVMVREGIPVLGAKPAPEKPVPFGWAEILLITGAIGAYALGVMASRAHDAGAFTPAVIGTRSGPGVGVLVVLCSILQAAGLVWGTPKTKTKTLSRTIPE